MRFFKKIGFSVLTLLGLSILFSCAAMADMEGPLSFTSVQMDSEGIEDSGPVQVRVVQGAKGISKFEISGFGKLFSLTKLQLAPLGDDKFNGLTISYSHGYSATGGRSIYVLLYKILPSGTEAAARVTVTEHGDPQVEAIKYNDKLR